jgi:hypothetical protein
MRWSKGMAVGVASVGIVAFACGRGDNAPERGESKAAVGYAPGRAGTVEGSLGGVNRTAVPEVAPAPMALATDATSMAAVAEPPDQLPSATRDSAAPAMIIRTGTATIKVDSLEPAVVRLRALAVSVGGYVGNTSMQTGADQLRSATVEIKVPAPRWGQLVAGLKPIGTLESENENAEDVGEEFVDVQARVANARRLETRLIDLLANRTGKLSDALQVERELARVREEIERYEGRMRYLRTRAAISTMTVTVHEPAPVLGSHPGDNPIAEAFRDAWRIFVGLIAFLISSLGIVIPLGILAWLAWRLLRRRRPRSTVD